MHARELADVDAVTDDPPLRYVVLHHTGHGPDHFDFMVERSPGSSLLLTWRITPGCGEAETPAEQLDDHRRAYLDDEGEVSGGRGSVRRVDAGTCRVGPADKMVFAAWACERRPDDDGGLILCIGRDLDDPRRGTVYPAGRITKVAWAG